MAIVEEYKEIPFFPEKINLAAKIYRDNTINEYEEIIITTHGRDGRNPSCNDGLEGLIDLNKALAKRGALVIFVVRRGYPPSEGHDAENLKTPEECAYAGAQDLSAAVDFARNLDPKEIKANKENIIILGQSQGGWIALAASCLDLKGVVSIVNLSGAINYYEKRPTEPALLNPQYYERLRICAEEFGKKSRIKTTWIYAENDHNKPIYMKKIFNSYKENGGKGDMHMLGEYKDYGHAICESPELFIEYIK